MIACVRKCNWKEKKNKKKKKKEKEDSINIRDLPKISALFTLLKLVRIGAFRMYL